MSQPDFGMRDMNEPAFWFEVRFGEDLSFGSLIVLSKEEMAQQMKDANIYSLNSLKDHPCQIETEAEDTMSNWGKSIKFVKIIKK